TPPDIDGNGKVIIVYTRTVNELTPRNSSSYIGGLTAPRDLFPTSSTPGGPPVCPGSNAAEMFYMLVPDSTGAVNGNVRSKSFVLGVTVGTIAHEYQHLINAGRRIYVLHQSSATWSEEIWLNEGLSHMAEELTYYRSSKNTPRANLTPATIRSSQAQVDAYNNFFSGNFGRYRSFLGASAATSPYASNDDLSTRGATWSFLRYAADRLGETDGDLWFRLVNTPTIGLANLQGALGVDQTAFAALVRDWATSVYVDDFVGGVLGPYTQPSWNWRALYLGLCAQPLAFPLTATGMIDATPTPAALIGGSSMVL